MRIHCLDYGSLRITLFTITVSIWGAPTPLSQREDNERSDSSDSSDLGDELLSVRRKLSKVDAAINDIRKQVR